MYKVAWSFWILRDILFDIRESPSFCPTEGPFNFVVMHFNLLFVFTYTRSQNVNVFLSNGFRGEFCDSG